MQTVDTRREDVDEDRGEVLGGMHEERWRNARKKVEEIVATSGPDDLRERVNRAKENNEAYRFRLEGRRWLLEQNGTAFDYIGFGRELRQVARELGRDADGTERTELRERALQAFRTAISLDDRREVRHPAYVGAAAVFRDLGDRKKAEELCREVLSQNPNDQYARASLDAS